MITQQEFNNLKSRDDVPLRCKGCDSIFYGKKHKVMALIKNKKSARQNYDYCSIKCFGKSNIKQITLTCQGCGKKITKNPSEIKSSKSGYSFCSKSCAITYHNTHKKTGYRRSKLEVWVEEQLSKLYPKLEIHFNRKDTINSELDIYIPSLKLAFELNGIFHYEPIYGKEKLSSIKNNDGRKFQACIEQKIELCIIDTSNIKYFKISNVEPFLRIIKDIIDKKSGPNTQI